MKLIDKDYLIQYLTGMADAECCDDNTERIIKKFIIPHINTIEMKEVNLKKEFSQWWKDERAKDYNVDILYEKYSNVSMKLVKHSFELGIKTKGE